MLFLLVGFCRADCTDYDVCLAAPCAAKEDCNASICSGLDLGDCIDGNCLYYALDYYYHCSATIQESTIKTEAQETLRRCMCGQGNFVACEKSDDCTEIQHCECVPNSTTFVCTFVYNCTPPPVCANGIREAGEECDLGAGCSQDCQCLPGYTKLPAPSLSCLPASNPSPNPVSTLPPPDPCEAATFACSINVLNCDTKEEQCECSADYFACLKRASCDILEQYSDQQRKDSGQECADAGCGDYAYCRAFASVAPTLLYNCALLVYCLLM